MEATDQHHLHVNSVDCANQGKSRCTCRDPRSKSFDRVPTNVTGTSSHSDMVSTNHHALAEAFTSENMSSATTRERIMYLIRHGEAQHNVIEQEAMNRARSRSINDGYGPESPETLRRMEEARQHAIEDSRLSNCPLSDKGRDDAAHAKNLLENIIQENSLPPPTEVIVSPLKRALQTASIVFPGHSNIRIRKEVRERLTGKPCDSMSPGWERRRRHSLRNLMRESPKSSSSDGNHASTNISSRLWMSKLASYPMRKASYLIKNKGTFIEEDNEMVRERIRTKLFALIEKSEHDSIALVTHKGTLRELERGPFGMVSASEFGNGEVRVYRVRFSADEEDPSSIDIDMAERIA